MRWIWIDRFTAFESGVSAVAVKTVSLAEEHLHDHFPGWPIHPPSLIIEGMAQTAGILAGEARQFSEKVILAKVKKAEFLRDATAGETLEFHATLNRIDDTGADTSGTVRVRPAGGGETVELATIDLMFSHADKNMQGLDLPEHNFVFHEQFQDLVAGILKD